jgi:viroplasmin and RNaseH domain-containing protein
MTTIKIFSEEEVEKIFKNSRVYMGDFFKESLKLKSYYSSEFGEPKEQLALIYALDNASKDVASSYINQWESDLIKDRKTISELELNLENKKKHLEINQKRFKEIKHHTSIKRIFESLSKID